MKKFGLSGLVLIIVAAIYYFTAGATQLTTKMKAQVDKELTTLQTQGFSVEGREVSEKKEHFVIALDEPQKVVAFLNTQGAQLQVKDVAVLKGAKLGVDVSYLADGYSAASFDIYPLALPPQLTTATLDNDDKVVLSKMKELIAKKTFLLHVDMNKLGNGFKGYMKDIHEIVDDKNKLTLTMTGLKFTGDLKDDKLSGIKQTLKVLKMADEAGKLSMQIENLSTDYAITGTHKYDYTTHYNIEKILVTSKDTFAFTIDTITGSSSSKVSHDLVSLNTQAQVQSMHFKEAQKESRFDTLLFNMKATNLDANALTKFETIDPNNENEVLAVMQELISHGLHFEIPNFSVKHIVFENKTLDGFKLNSALDVNKSLNLTTVQQNPLSAINALDANLHLSLSSQLFGLLAQQPQAMMAMMLFQPKDVNGDKVYTVELKGGKLYVNGKQAM